MQRTFATLALAALATAGCGSTKTFANRPRPAVPVNLTVYINNGSVSVSPPRVGAGEVTFIVTNQASSAQSLEVLAPGQSGNALASTGPINPMATAQISVDFPAAGDYTVATGPNSTAEAALSTPVSIRPATLHVGPHRRPSTNALLLP